jgi:2-keto-4-pentenoate hydratase
MTLLPAGASEDLAQRLCTARASGAAPIDVPSNLIPETSEASYGVQERSLELLGWRPGGWKVGAKSMDGPIQGAPLPADGIHASPATLRRADFAVVGLELEIAFCFGRPFAPASRSYAAEEVIEGVASFCAAIEVVSSRLAAWPRESWQVWQKSCMIFLLRWCKRRLLIGLALQPPAPQRGSATQ